MACEVRFRKQAESGYAASAGKLVPVSISNCSKIKVTYDFLEQRAQQFEVAQRLCAAPLRIHNPFDPIHIGETSAIAECARIQGRTCLILAWACRS